MLMSSIFSLLAEAMVVPCIVVWKMSSVARKAASVFPKFDLTR